MLIECKDESEFSTEPPAELGMAIYEVNRFNGSEPSAEQKRAAEEFARRCFEVAEERNWYDFDTAIADGYKKLFRDRIHYANEEFIMDDRVLDPERPEYLMYYKVPGGGIELSGFMFVVRSPLEEGSLYPHRTGCVAHSASRRSRARARDGRGISDRGQRRTSSRATRSSRCMISSSLPVTRMLLLAACGTMRMLSLSATNSSRVAAISSGTVYSRTITAVWGADLASSPDADVVPQPARSASRTRVV